MFFDLSSMQPAEQIRARDAAVKFIDTQMTASDVVSIMTLTNELRVVQDFTNDRETLLTVIQSLRIGDSSELAGLAATGADATDDSGEFTADDTEFNIFNTDLKLSALEDATRKLAPFPEKKALVYFSSGIGKTGVDNQSQLRATVNAAVRANVAFYPIDARGSGCDGAGRRRDASIAQRHGRLHRQRADQRAHARFTTTQDTIYTLAADTGGKALLDSNDLTLGIKAVQTDINSYYILGYYSENPAQDGKYRHVTVKIASLPESAKLDYRKRLLRRESLGQDEFERQGTPARRRADARRSVHGSAARAGGGLFPDRARQILRTDYGPDRRVRAGSIAEVHHGSRFHRADSRSAWQDAGRDSRRNQAEAD